MKVVDRMQHLRIIQYLGSKLNLKDQIKNEIDEISEVGDTVLDLYSGTGVISEALKNDYNVISNDIQLYSKYLSEFLLNDDIIVHKNDIDYLFNSNYYIKNKKSLTEQFESLLTLENESLRDKDINLLIQMNTSNIFYNQYTEENISGKVLSAYREVKHLFDDKTIDEYKSDHNKFPNILFTLYYHGGYFGLHQCIEIDSIIYAINNDPNIDENMRKYFINSIMSYLSEIVTSVGKHFAQPMKLKYSNGEIKRQSLDRYVADRKKDVRDIFYDFFYRIKREKVSSDFHHEIFNYDSIDLLKQIEKNKIDIAYLDPPYTIDHYSRFYHVLETIVLYDYPSLEYTREKKSKKLMNGRYRNDRFQSNFSITSMVKSEFEIVFKELNRISCNIVLSYSDVDKEKKTRSRVIGLEELLEIASNYYNNVEVKRLSHTYRKLNSSEVNSESSTDTELIIICQEAKEWKNT